VELDHAQLFYKMIEWRCGRAEQTSAQLGWLTGTWDRVTRAGGEVERTWLDWLGGPLDPGDGPLFIILGDENRCTLTGPVCTTWTQHDRSCGAPPPATDQMSHWLYKPHPDPIGPHHAHPTPTLPRVAAIQISMSRTTAVRSRSTSGLWRSYSTPTVPPPRRSFTAIPANGHRGTLA
jgi:hypothetical protein